MSKTDSKDKGFKLPKQIPIIPLMNMVVFPNVIVPLVIEDQDLINLINDAINTNRVIGVFANKPDKGGNIEYDKIYDIGTVAFILKMFKGEDGGKARILVQGLQRVSIDKIISRSPYLTGEVSEVKEKISKGLKFRALVRMVKDAFINIIDTSSNLPEDLKIAVASIKDPSKLADMVASNINLEIAKRQQLLREADVSIRLNLLAAHLNKEIKLLKLTNKIQKDVNEELERDQRDYYLREQLRAIRRELGEDNDESQELEELRDKIENSQMSEEAYDAAHRELKRLNRMSSASSEYTVSITYLDWLIDLPWDKYSEDSVSLEEATSILDQDHFGLQEPKERVLEYLAVKKMKQDYQGSILCLVGPPGVGKTSFGKSIARALGKECVRASLGGVRDESEIRGHRRTYIGSMPGVIIKNIKKAGVSDPVILLDEVDKLGISNMGDPASALLEVLDPNQNSDFVDHYIDVPYDLSKIVFIMTANYRQNIPQPLLDRMEVIELPSYVIDEKLEIAIKYLVPRQLKKNGIKKKNLQFTKKGILEIIEKYTQEAGVRKLDQKIEKICRKAAIKIINDAEIKIKVDKELVRQYLGNKYLNPVMLNRKNEIGVSTGLAWSPVGGSVLFIESTKMAGKGVVNITGQLGDVMKESVKIAYSYLKSNAQRLGIKKLELDKNDVHIHVPDGATPKDGPSAGLAITLSLISLFTGIPINKYVAMTGEISLRGKALEIGGLKEKAIAAQKAGIRKILIPDSNMKDIEDIPQVVRKHLEIIPVLDIDQVLANAFVTIPKSMKLKKT